MAKGRKSARLDEVSVSGWMGSEGMALVQKSANRDSHRPNSKLGQLGPCRSTRRRCCPAREIPSRFWFLARHYPHAARESRYQDWRIATRSRVPTEIRPGQRQTAFQ